MKRLDVINFLLALAIVLPAILTGAQAATNQVVGVNFEGGEQVFHFPSTAPFHAGERVELTTCAGAEEDFSRQVWVRYTFVGGRLNIEVFSNTTKPAWYTGLVRCFQADTMATPEQIRTISNWFMFLGKVNIPGAQTSVLAK